MRVKHRWHLLDYGHMSAAFFDGSILRDAVHPLPFFLLEALNMVLNLFQPAVA